MDSPPEDDDSSLSTLELEVNKYLDKESIDDYNDYPGVEMIDYDYAAERKNIYPTNVIESTAHLIKSCLGAGILGMHEAYMCGGIWTSLGLTFVVGFLVSYSMWMLVKSAQTMYGRLRVPKLSYPDLAEVAIATGPLKSCRRFSKAFRYLTDIFLFLYFNGTCCVFEIMIAQTLKQVLVSITDYQISMSYLILIITVPLVGLCVIRSLKYLAPFSVIADLIVVLCVLTTMYYSISVAADLNKRPAWKSMHGLFRFLGICLYSINGIGVALPIENNMRRPEYFRTVLQWGMPFVVTLVMIIGFFGYWAWGEQCHSPFTIHMPTKMILIIMQGLLAITLGVTFAVHFWVPFRIIWHYLARHFKRKRGIWERLFRTIYVFLISCLSIAFPNLGTWMTFLGNFFTAFLVFIFPAIMETLITWKEPRKFIFRFSLLKNLSFILFGLFLGGGAFYSW
ncbi:proton-coupled amino acid transporter-like protein pathetic [Maniola hyperantus]|uniref:proton-coupled amino acid transporter-like protein pathetic n=1 Tax=Aphantopus hyperantus TaxID=2795564 RepID=UPI00156A5BC8|nr:proton-coupled amino acid transporter-like protein pathetic [Maniola hyperantus]